MGHPSPSTPDTPIQDPQLLDESGNVADERESP